MNAEDAPLSGDPEIDSLAVRRWGDNTLTFGFPTVAAQFTGYSSSEPASNFEGLNQLQQAAARAIFASISTFANLTFIEIAGGSEGTAVLRFGMTDETQTAHAYLPTTSEAGGDSWYRNSGAEYDNPVRGNYAWTTFMHEIGHALGLGHPHEADPPMPAGHDWLQYSVMSYRSFPGSQLSGYVTSSTGFPQSYMMEDIATLQFLYGANFNHNSGNSTYTWNPMTGEMSINGFGQGAPVGNSVFLTVWDGGGTDTFDFSNYVIDPSGSQTGVNINLLAGEATLLNRQDPNLGSGPIGANVLNPLLYNNDPRSLIENAVGTNGNDFIQGNQADNFFTGGAGSDLLHGDAGNDTLIGGNGTDGLYGDAGNDTLYGEDGGDLLAGGFGHDILYGGQHGDTLYGGADDDFLDAGNGDDFLHGGEGADVLTGGAGNDTLRGDGGNDTMTGGVGDDWYSVDSASDQVIESAGEGTDRVDAFVSYIADPNIERIDLGATTGYNELALNAAGNELDNTIYGNGGNNVIDGGIGSDTMFGKYGDDTFYVDNETDTVYDIVGAGNDTIHASVSFVLAEVDPTYNPYVGASIGDPNGGKVQIELLVLTGSANTSATGNSYGSTFRGNSGNNLIDARAGNDILIGGSGADELIGGLGADVFVYDAPSDSTTEQQDWLSDFAAGTDLIDLRLIAAEDISFVVGPGGSTMVTVAVAAAPSMVIRVAGVATLADVLWNAVTGSETLTGTDGDDMLDGGGGNDVLIGGLGADVLTGGSGIDLASYEDNYGAVYASLEQGRGYWNAAAGDTYAGIEQLRGSLFGDFLEGDGAANLLDGNAGNDLLIGGLGADALIGGSGIDTASYEDNWGGVFASLWANLGVGNAAHGDTYAGIENLRGSLFDDYLIGSSEVNLIEGGAGNDTLTGGLGADVIDGGEGIDTVAYDDNWGLVYVNLWDGLGYANAAHGDTFVSIENVRGSMFDDTIVGSLGVNRIDGGAGNDLLIGALSGDALIGGDGTDTVSYADNFGQVFVNLYNGTGQQNAAEGDTYDGIENIVGSIFGDTLVGTDGGNTINGGLGNDYLIGAGGGDNFVFADAIGGGHVDTIADFEVGSDHILLASYTWGLTAGASLDGLFGSGASATAAGAYIVYDPVTGVLAYDPDSNGAGAAIAFAQLSAGLNLTANDFLVV